MRLVSKSSRTGTSPAASTLHQKRSARGALRLSPLSHHIPFPSRLSCGEEVPTLDTDPEQKDPLRQHRCVPSPHRMPSNHLSSVPLHPMIHVFWSTMSGSGVSLLNPLGNPAEARPPGLSSCGSGRCAGTTRQAAWEGGLAKAGTLTVKEGWPRQALSWSAVRFAAPPT